MDVDESKLGTPTTTNRRNSVWLVVEPTPLKTMKVSWDDCSQYMEQIKHVWNHQPVYHILGIIIGFVTMYWNIYHYNKLLHCYIPYIGIWKNKTCSKPAEVLQVILKFWPIVASKDARSKSSRCRKRGSRGPKTAHTTLVPRWDEPCLPGPTVLEVLAPMTDYTTKFYPSTLRWTNIGVAEI